MMVVLERELGKRGISFHRTKRRIRCFPHVVNLACQAVLAAITHIHFAAENAADFVRPEWDAPEEELYGDEARWATNDFLKQLRRRDPIATLRSLIRAVCMSNYIIDTKTQHISDSSIIFTQATFLRHSTRPQPEGSSTTA
jgi:hypothetical protein